MNEKSADFTFLLIVMEIYIQSLVNIQTAGRIYTLDATIPSSLTSVAKAEHEILKNIVNCVVWFLNSKVKV